MYLTNCGNIGVCLYKIQGIQIRGQAESGLPYPHFLVLATRTKREGFAR